MQTHGQSVRFELALNYNQSTVQQQKAERLKEDLLEVIRGYLPFSPEGAQISMEYQGNRVQVVIVVPSASVG